MHNRQFVLGTKQVEVSDKTLSEKLNDSMIFSYDAELTVIQIKDASDTKWFLLGEAFQTTDNLPTPEKQIRSHKTEDILDITKGWGGRWVLLSQNHLIMDAGGNLGCFYTEIDGSLWVSSSASVLETLHKAELITAPTLKHERGMDFYPGPFTRFESIFRLLPSQMLRITKNSYKIEYKKMPSDINLKKELVLDLLEEKLLSSIKTIYKNHENIWLPLTGGQDSRLILAAAYKADVPVTTYTFHKPFPDMTSADRKIPKLLSRELGFEHHLIKRGSFSDYRQKEFDKHTGKMALGMDKNYYAYGLWDKIPKSPIILRGGMFELGQGFYYTSLDPHQSNAKNSIHQSFDFQSNHIDSFTHYQSTNYWVEWINDNSISDIDWRDRLYFDQRIGSWLSSIEQGLDLTGTTRVHIANSYSILSALLSLPLEYRESGQHYTDLINRMCPSLLKYSFNPSDSIVHRGFRKIKRTLLK